MRPRINRNSVPSRAQCLAFVRKKAKVENLRPPSRFKCGPVAQEQMVQF